MVTEEKARTWAGVHMLWTTALNSTVAGVAHIQWQARSSLQFGSHLWLSSTLLQPGGSCLLPCSGRVGGLPGD